MKIIKTKFKGLLVIKDLIENKCRFFLKKIIFKQGLFLQVIFLNNIDLPAPLGPIMVTKSLKPSSKSMFLRISFFPLTTETFSDFINIFLHSSYKQSSQLPLISRAISLCENRFEERVLLIVSVIASSQHSWTWSHLSQIIK